MDSILNRILCLIKENKIAKGKFLSDLGLDKSAISEWSRGTTTSYLKYLPQIASYFDVSLDWLAGTDQKNKPVTQRDELDPKDKEIIDKLKLLNPGNRDSALALIESLLKNQDKQ